MVGAELDGIVTSCKADDDAAVDPAIMPVVVRDAGDPDGFRQRSTAAIAAAVARASSRSSAAFKGADDVTGIVGAVIDTGEAAPTPAVTLALDCEAVTDVVGIV